MGYRRGKGKNKNKRRRNAARAERFLKGMILVWAVVALAVMIWLVVRLRAVRPENPKTGQESLQPAVCLDAGHGGKDCGAVGDGDRYEKTDNLRLTLLVKERLEERGVPVLLTREDDVFVSLNRRCDIANQAQAVLFVSMHRNSAKRASANGVEVWTAQNASPYGRELAQLILDGLEAVGISQNRGLQSGVSGNENKDYYVNKHTTMPSCLVEMGFITNEEDNALLDAHIEEYADVIADAIEKMYAKVTAPAESEAAGKQREP